MTAERFVGRDHELQQLRGLLDQAAAGRAGTVVLGGEAGVGKSRLLAQFVAEAEKDHQAHVLRGACIELGGGLIPYAPLVESLRMLVRERGEDEIRAAVTDSTWNDLEHLVSDFTGTAVAAAPDVAPSGSAQLRVFGAVLRMLEHLGKSAPVVLVFEDMHWADQSTLDLVSFLARRLSSERALLVCSHRSVLVPGHALRVLLAEPEFKRHVHPVTLPSFTERDLRDFIGALFPDAATAPDRDLVRRCHQLSGGNAYFAEQLLLSGALTDPNASRVPESINELMITRIAALSEPARQVMRVAAAAARRLDDRLLEAVCGLPSDVLDAALRECRNQGMLVVDPVEQESYAIQHALLSEAVYQQMGIGERRRLHTRMAEALTEDVALGLAHGWGAEVELAHHWFHTDHRPEALATAVRAGEATMRVRAFHEAESQYGRVLDELWARVPNPEAAAGRSHVDLLDAAAAASRWAGHVPQAVARLRKAIEAVAGQQDPGRLGELYERLGSYHWENGAVAEGRSAYTDAVRLLAAAAPEGAAHARALVGLAMAEIRAGSYQAALDRSERAVALAETAGDAAAMGRALNAVGLALSMAGRVGEGAPRLRQAVELADQEDHLEGLLGAYGNLAVALELAGDLDGSVAAARTGLERAQAIGVTELRLAIVLANNAGASLMLLGRWDEAGEVLARAMADRPRLELSAYLRLTVAEFDVARGEFAAAERLISEVGDQGITDPRFVAALHTCQAELACWKDQPSEALDAVRQGLAAVADTENVLVRLRLYSVGLRAAADRAARAVAAGTPTSEAAELGAELIADAEQQAATMPGIDEVQILLQLCRAEYHRTLGDDTVPLWDDVATAWARIGRPYPMAYARWRQAAAALAAGDEEAAAAAVAEAMDTATRLGAEPLKGAVEKLNADSGPQSQPQPQEPDSQQVAVIPVMPPVRPYRLTKREWEIFRILVTKAATNRQIAREFGIEETTVATHVYRICHKLDVQSRNEATVIALTTGLFEDPRGGAPTA
ncbi:DNA-binding CsgD family transcriptional regulator/tetratricopeptide (TPR) repeat protein [Catenulispora sp. EB89]|uniref:helix-turn-helix transcriptional regulator n=1 Tax=Catenulispora sp. EB89 TaxID=3156257 RepID=UPI0035170710